MRIGIDGRALVGQKTGVGRVLENLLNALFSLDQENQYVLYFQGNPASQPFSQWKREEKIIRLPVFENYFTWLHLRLPMELLIEPVDLFHYTFYTMPFFINCKSIVSIYDLTYELHPEWYSWKGLLAQRPFSRWAALKSQRIITDSETTKKDIVEFYRVKEEKISVIHHAVDPKFRILEDRLKIEEIKKNYGIEEKYLLFVGNINLRRNIERLLKAYQPFSKEVQLVLIGRVEWPYRNIEKMIEDSGLRKRAIHLGYVEGDHLPFLYNGALVFLYPSLYEGFGLPVLEAMSCGVPVVTSRTSALGELYSRVALTVDPYNPNDIEDGIGILLKDRKRREEFRKDGLEFVKKFSWEKAAGEILKIYREAFEG